MLSAGSNIVFGARIERPIVYLMSFNTNMSFGEDGTLECGASVRIQSLLEKMKEFSLGGIEYLASVPSSVGGAVYMNAGRGRKRNVLFQIILNLLGIWTLLICR